MVQSGMVERKLTYNEVRNGRVSNSLKELNCSGLERQENDVIPSLLVTSSILFHCAKLSQRAGVVAYQTLVSPPGIAESCCVVARTADPQSIYPRFESGCCRVEKRVVCYISLCEYLATY